MTKLDYIMSLNGQCPEGMEIQKYLAGGCVKCAKKDAAKAMMSCGGKTKKRITKAQNGNPAPKPKPKSPSLPKNDNNGWTKNDSIDHQQLVNKYRNQGRKLSPKEMKRLQDLNKKRTETTGDGV